jgi:hypothetical protein
MGKNLNHRNLTAVCLAFAVILGVFYAWNYRHYMNPDGIAYLDMADAYLEGQWARAINSYWSPFYSWLLGLAIYILQPSAYWEFALTHLLNLIIYLFALGCFSFFLRELLSYQQSKREVLSKEGIETLPEWSLIIVGYTLFVWFSLRFIKIYQVTPDLTLSAFIYLISGIILRIRKGFINWRLFFFLGIILGLGYLTKTVMFVLSFVFMLVSLLVVKNVKKALPRILITLITFILIVSPLIFILTKTKGRLTFGDNARIAYAWYINDVPYYAHWQGEPAGSGYPEHTTRKLFDDPAIYEFATPIKATYPVWYDVSYWYEGVRPYFNLRGQARVLMKNLKIYSKMLFASLQTSMLIGFLVLCFIGKRRPALLKDLGDQWNLLIPAISALAMYSLIHLQTRYVGVFFVLFWMGLFSSLRFPSSEKVTRIINSIVLVMLMPMIIFLFLSIIPKAYSAVKYIIYSNNGSDHLHYQVAKGLEDMGIRQGDRVASIGACFDAYWARVLRCRIIAEIPDEYIDDFWKSKDDVKNELIKTFKTTGAKALIAKDIPLPVHKEGWQRVGNTDYYVYMLN